MSYIGNSPGVASQRVTTTLTAAAAQTQFTTQSGYVLGYVDVYLNGVKLVNGADFEAITGTYITLFAGALAGDVVELVSYVPRGLTDGYTKAEADAKFLDVGGDSASGTINLATNGLIVGTNQLVASGGKVGVGTASPTETLTVIGGNIKTDSTSRRIGYWEADTVHDGYLIPYNASGQTELVNSFTTGGISFKTGTSKAERMLIDTSGNIISNTPEGYLYFTSTYSVGSNTRGSIRTVGTGGGSGYGGDLRFSTRKPDNTWNENAFVIDSSGNVGVNTILPSSYLSGNAKLAIYGNQNSLVASFVRNDSSGSSAAAALALNAYGNTWGIEIGSTAKNNNALTFQLDYGGAGSEKMRLTTAGYLGIGTTSPSNPLHVYSATPPGSIAVKFETTADSWIQLTGGTSQSSWQIGSTAAGLQFYNDNTTAYRVTIAKDGNVGIGTANPDSWKLNITGNAISNGGDVSNLLSLRASTNSYLSFRAANEGGTAYQRIISTDGIQLHSSSTERIRITPTGRVGINTSNPLTTLDVNGTIRNAAGVKTYGVITPGLGAQSVIYEIGRISRDTANWSEQLGYDITVYNRYYLGGVARWYVMYNQVESGSVILRDSGGTHRNRVYLGTEVTVSGTVKYRPILVEIPAYQQLAIELKYTNLEVSSITGSSQIQFTGTVTNASVANFNSRYSIESPLGIRSGRTVYGWFEWGGNPGGKYLHIKTNLWGGGSPNGNSQPTMSLFHIKGYSYDAHTIDAMIGFHNWSGTPYNLRVSNSGSYAGTHSAYVSTDGYIVLVIDATTNYPGISIDHYQSYGYGWQDVGVITFSSSANSSGVY